MNSGELEPEIMKCFRKCLKIAGSVLDLALQVQLYVEILANLTLCVRFSNDEITEMIRSLVGLIQERRAETALPELVDSQFNGALDYFKKNGLQIPAV